MKLLRKTSIGLIASLLLVGSSAVFGASSDSVLTGSQGQAITTVTTFAGTGQFGSVNIDAANSTFRSPLSLLALPDGSVLVSDSTNQLIRKISKGTTTTFAGFTLTKNDMGLPVGGLVDGKSAESIFQGPNGLAVDNKGNVFVADTDNNAIREISADGQVSTIAGNGVAGNADGKGNLASFNHPQDVAVTADGTLYVADTLNHLIRKITSDGTVSTLNAPSSRSVAVIEGDIESAGDYKDGNLKDALFNEPSGMALDAKGNLYVSDSGNQRIRYINLTSGSVTTAAGSALADDGKSTYNAESLYATGDFADGKALEAKFNIPRGIALTAEGGLVIADSLNHSIRYLMNGKVTTIAGDSKQSNGYFNGIDRSAQFHEPSDVAVMADGSILVADSFNNKIRKITFNSLPSGAADNKSIKVLLEQNVITFDAQPENVKNRVMVPVRYIAEALGYKVEYLGNGTIVQLTKGTSVIVVTVGSDQTTTTIKAADANSKDVQTTTKLDSVPYVKSSRTYVPLRFFAETVGLDVQWNSSHQTVILRDKTLKN